VFVLALAGVPVDVVVIGSSHIIAADTIIVSNDRI